MPLLENQSMAKNKINVNNSSDIANPIQYAMISIVLFNLIGILGMYFVSEK